MQQLQAEEVEADDARLTSVDSLQAWVMTHPALRQMAIFDQLSQIGPAILQVIRSLLGL